MNKPFSENITKDDIMSLPLQAFEGNIHLIEKESECIATLSLLKKEPILGFDTEAKPTFNKGEYNHTALVQLSTLEDAYLFRLNLMGYPRSLFDLFQDDSIQKLGISIADDLKNLQKARKFKPASFIDLNDIAKKLGIHCMGVKQLASIFLNVRISKKQQVSNWEAKKLTTAQLKYAATDAWICRAIYEYLEKKKHFPIR